MPGHERDVGEVWSVISDLSLEKSDNNWGSAVNLEPTPQ